MTGTPNQLTPRAVAVLRILQAIRDVRMEIEDHADEARDTDALFHSQIRVFLEQTIVELKRAAVFLEFHDMSEDEP